MCKRSINNIKFSIYRDFFLKILNNYFVKISSRNFNSAILNFIKLTLNDDCLTLIGGNNDVIISVLVPRHNIDQNEENIFNCCNGDVIIDRKILIEIISKIYNNEITFSLCENEISIDDKKTSFHIGCPSGFTPNDYPKNDFNKDDDVIKFKIKSIGFIDLIERTNFASAIREEKEILASINLKNENGKLTAIALDGMRCAINYIFIEQQMNFNISLPSKVISEIIRLFPSNVEIEIFVKKTNIFFRFNDGFNDVEISSKLTNTNFPNINVLEFEKFKYFLEIDSREIKSAIERISILNNEKQIKLCFNNGVLIFSSDLNFVDDNFDNVKEIMENYMFFDKKKNSNFHFEILFDGKHVIDAIKALKCDRIVFQFISEREPFIVKSVDNDYSIHFIAPFLC